MRYIAWLIVLFLIALPLQAQDNSTPYDTALQRIEEARVSDATELDLSELGLTELPPEIGQLNNLQVLLLNFNDLFGLPAEIGQLADLQYLGLWGNHLSSLPAEIGQLTNLRGLGLDNNQLRSLPAEIGNLTNLCFLHLENNNFSHLPVELGNLALLSESGCFFYFDGNPLISPPQEVIAQGAPAVLAYLRNQAWWHLQRLVISVASGVGLLAIVFLLLRWRYRQQFSRKKKRV